MVEPQRVEATDKGQIVLPVNLRRELGIEGGTEFEVYAEKGRIILIPRTVESLSVRLDHLQGIAAGFPLLEELMSERALDREREDRKFAAQVEATRRSRVRQLGISRVSPERAQRSDGKEPTD